MAAMNSSLCYALSDDEPVHTFHTLTSRTTDFAYDDGHGQTNGVLPFVKRSSQQRNIVQSNALQQRSIEFLFSLR